MVLCDSEWFVVLNNNNSIVFHRVGRDNDKLFLETPGNSLVALLCNL